MPQPKDKRFLKGYNNKTLVYAIYKRTLQNNGHKQNESEGLEKDISQKWRPKESRSSNTDIT